MCADVISLHHHDHQTVTPTVDPYAVSYALDLEHENAELREMLATAELRRYRRLKAKRRAVKLRARSATIAVACTLLAFLCGWMIDPPALLHPTPAVASAFPGGPQTACVPFETHADLGTGH